MPNKIENDARTFDKLIIYCSILVLWQGKLALCLYPHILSSFTHKWPICQSKRIKLVSQIKHFINYGEMVSNEKLQNSKIFLQMVLLPSYTNHNTFKIVSQGNNVLFFLIYTLRQKGWDTLLFVNMFSIFT